MPGAASPSQQDRRNLNDVAVYFHQDEMVHAAVDGKLGPKGGCLSHSGWPGRLPAKKQGLAKRRRRYII